MGQKIVFAGQGAADRIASFLQNNGQQIINQCYGGAFNIGLAPGETFLIPVGEWLTQAGSYSDLQYFDQQSLMWRNFSAFDNVPMPMASDGTNFRFANLSGCPVGAVITTAGTTLGASYPVTMFAPNGSWVGGVFTAAATPALVVTPSAGASTWNTFIGGAINTTIAITGGGTGYTTAPKLVIVPPASQGSQPFIPATAVCTISGGVINAVTVTNQGAGYVAAPQVLVLNQPGDTTGAGAVLTPALTGAGQLTAIIQATPGTVLTAVPTLAFSGSAAPASAAATVIMNFSLTNTAGSGVTAGAGNTNGYTMLSIGGISTATPVYTNPAIEKGIVTPVQPNIYSLSTTVVAVNNAASIFVSGGIGFQVVPSLQGVGVTTSGFITTPGVGGNNDVCLLYPI
jgi:hypothetical protein